MTNLVLLIYPLAAFILYRHWSTEHRILWWTILVSVVLMAWTKLAIKNAMVTAVRELADRMFDGNVEVAEDAEPWIGDDVVRFWTNANMVTTLVTLVASVIGLFTPRV